ncbi:MAG: hydroxyacylglutathione hydrolase [Gammaproteobacteria bacterium]|nr:hydroxyacylglutathione hydrolase [Gammaproteobacteria bacterium]
MIRVLYVKAFDDNYIWLIQQAESNYVVVVDPGDEIPVIKLLERENLVPAAIFCTHHHWDHVGGVTELRSQYHNIPVFGPANENIAEVTHPVRDGDQIDLDKLKLKFKVIGVPGHTRGHVAYFGHGMLFCGDCLFSGGCGRLFEGTAEEMHQSLSRLAALPTDTQVYCAHEYTASNLRFGRTVEPKNPAIHTHIKEITRLDKEHQPSLPSTIGLELEINPFLRTNVDTVKQAACRHSGKDLTSDIEVLAEIRRWKDNFS